MVVLVVVGGAHAPPVQASQQLVWSLTQALPSAGDVQVPALLRMPHLRPPPTSVRQQATAPARPHVERTAQRTTAPRHWRRSCWAATASCATAATQRTYCAWRCAPAQSQRLAAVARVAATASASPGWSPHAAKLDGTATEIHQAISPGTRNRMAPPRPRAAGAAELPAARLLGQDVSPGGLRRLVAPSAGVLRPLLARPDAALFAAVCPHPLEAHAQLRGLRP
jgi:hypothetical protein